MDNFTWPSASLPSAAERRPLRRRRRKRCTRTARGSTGRQPARQSYRANASSAPPPGPFRASAALPAAASQSPAATLRSRAAARRADSHSVALMVNEERPFVNSAGGWRAAARGEGWWRGEERRRGGEER
eukprot:CAMPEP_0185391802 /NCGR_PEP_ID=MMETSP1364-20130426/75187_1 /TAXON_ID=38817 /ORGANISM="Gephyrocapsa oceanica, Strain RCC1303" /LENGTH=129 /DNA_ID=CAMNT_0027993831 /DNA_START=232 /DNA_END=617 /DNA_ORIENTATION=-